MSDGKFDQMKGRAKEVGLETSPTTTTSAARARSIGPAARPRRNDSMTDKVMDTLSRRR